MDPVQRQWWRLLDDLPRQQLRVHRWLAEPAAEPGGSLAADTIHPNPTAVVCLAGVVRLTRPGATLDLQPGEALLIAAGVWHEHHPLRPGAVCFGQGFLPAWSDVRLADHRRSWAGKLPSEPSRQLLASALDCPDSGERAARFSELIRQVLAESVSDQVFATPALQRMVQRLWSGLHHGLTTAELLRASGLSRAQAYRLFTAGYGVPPKEAIARTRLWLAESLLESDLPIAAIATRCGYPSAGTFTRAWRRAHGRPPRTCRGPQ
jgi:AraC-like DNA-binding protein